MQERGVLLHISSLPSPHGIGSLGKAAYDFVDYLAAAGFRYWQMLPIGPTGYGDSPYQTFSAFAGNPYFIDLDLCVGDGLTGGRALPEYDFGSGEYIDYGKLFENRIPALRFIYDCGKYDKAGCDIFARQNGDWLENYALFAALKIRFGHLPWNKWDGTMRNAQFYSEDLADEINFQKFVQYLFFSQFGRLRAYAREKGVSLIGDIPIYCGYDSADVWGNPQLFDLGENFEMKEAAGVPPDYFSKKGQYWGNPLFDWPRHKADGYKWWISRIAHGLSLFDILRIDHFRGFESYYAVPVTQGKGGDARKGVWKKGPGMDLFGAVNRELNNPRIIAEDLGEITPEVKALIKAAGYPGMRVLQFAFDGNPANPHLPCNFKEPCVVYTGTHDNMTAKGWYGSRTAAQKKIIRKAIGYDGKKHKSIARALIETAFNSAADIAIVPMQDLLNYGNEARMNRPSKPQGNWQWRMSNIP